MEAIRSPSFWSAVGVILAAVGVEINLHLVQQIVEAVAIIAGIVGVLTAAREGTQ